MILLFQGKDWGSGALPLWKVCLMWCCSDAMVTGTAENKPQAPGGLSLLSTPHFPAHYRDSNRKCSKVEGSCVSASKSTRGQNILIWARKPNLPLHCGILQGFLGGGCSVSSSFGLVSHRQEMKERWRQHTQWRLSHKLIDFPRSGRTNWDPQLNPFLLGQPLLCSPGKELHVTGDSLCSGTIDAALDKWQKWQVTTARPKNPPVCVHKI